jgi:hypothetical protein
MPATKKNASVKAIRTLSESSSATAKKPIDLDEVRHALEKEYKSKIEWLTDQEIIEAGNQLLKLKRAGMKCEEQRDFVNSGKIAFRLRDLVNEIGKTTKLVPDGY